MNDQPESLPTPTGNTTPGEELLGTWINWAGDDAGLGAIWGYGIEFKENGEGLNLDWGTEISKEEEETPFCWKRVGAGRIRVWYPDDQNSESEEIDYEISDHIGGYKRKYLKINEIDKSGFWISPEPLFKPNETNHNKGSNAIAEVQESKTKNEKPGLWAKFKNWWL